MTLKLGNWLLLHIALLVLQVAYPEAFNCNPVNDSSYKSSMHTKMCTWLQPMTTWLQNIATNMGTGIQSWNTRRTTHKKLARARAMAARNKPPPLRSKHKHNPFRALAFAAIASLPATQGHGHYRNQMIFDTDSGPIGVDNRCTGCISHRIDDFEGPLADSDRAIKGFGGTRTMNVKVGTIVWKWLDDNGKLHKFKIPKSYYVPAGNIRLLSPQHWAKAQNDRTPLQGTGCETLDNQVTLFWNQRKTKLTIPLGRDDNVATFQLASGYDRFTAFCAEAGMNYEDEQDNPLLADDTQIVRADDDPGNDVYEDSRQPGSVAKQRDKDDDHWITPDGTTHGLDGKHLGHKVPIIVQDEEDRQATTPVAKLLKYHHRFGHVSFYSLQQMAREGIIPHRLAKCPIPVCSACLYAKATRRAWRSRSTTNNDETEVIKKPGYCVSVDQLVSPTPGFVAQMTGILTTARYTCATVYVDQASRLSFTYLQKTASAEETLEGKIAFELYAKDRGVLVTAYHADNGIFRAHKWVQACRMNGQRLTFAGVNAHHQNGMAERRIRSLQELARAMLIHATKRWPKATTANLWPYAIRMANMVLNETPNMKDDKKRTPQQVFSGTATNINAKHWKPFGCPVYVLNTALQKGQPHHKWKQRSRVGIYLGPSPQHARTVALVLDRETGLVSPQFHVVFDPSFQTVLEDKLDSTWQIKAGFVSQRELQPPQAPKTATQGTNKRKSQEHGPTRRTRPGTSATPRSSVTTPNNNQLTTFELSPNEGSPEDANPVIPEPQQEVQHSDQTRSGRTRLPVNRLIEAMLAETSALTVNGIEGEIFCLQALYPDHKMIENPLQVYKATSDPDTMYMHEALKQSDRKEFIKAMEKEWNDQYDNGNFTIVHKSKVPKDKTILPTVWQMKRKRDIKTRQIKKYKARLNIDGSRMKHGTDYDQTYAPVASWNSIRTLLTMTALHDWHTKQLDFVLAFPQALVEREIYMTIPKGFEINEGRNEDYVLLLHRNVYGQKQAGRVWNQHLTKILINRVGFTQSKVDDCVFYKGQVMYVLYTDDSILAGPDEDEINQVIADMRKAKLDITIEGDLQDFLGVNIERKADGTIHLTQPHLIDQILADLRLDKDDVKIKKTPASSSKLLSRHSDSEPFDESFHYRSVIGKLNYLERGSRSDISYIVHQCARFSSDPKVEHGEALRWLGRYLKGTRDKGTILKPVKGKGLELFVDADFAGNWDPNEWEDRDTARSRHGYIIKYAGCPLTWKSQLQTEIALSSTESEYTGLSYGLREAIPLMEILKEMKERDFPIDTVQSKVHCRVFEDNSGAVEIAKNHKFRPRTKHLNVKLHHFRGYVNRQEISIHPIGTASQDADFLTKALNEFLLKRHRFAVMGW